jgi:hypothetical protein
MLPAGRFSAIQLASGDSEKQSVMNETQSETRASESAKQPPAKRRVSVFWWLFGLVLLGIILVNEVPRQIRGWKLATALEAREAGDKARATQLLNELVEKNPRDDVYRFTQYEWNKEDAKRAAGQAARMRSMDWLMREHSQASNWTPRSLTPTRLWPALART